MAPSCSGNSGSNGKTTVVVMTIDRVINVNSLFNMAIFVGLSVASPGQKSLNSSECFQTGILTCCCQWTTLRTGMLIAAISSVMGCLFLMVPMLNVIEIKTGMPFCGS
ncbi:hypothetical protein HAX54_031799 [Datura stramonium]|uniref:Uncharacterized protein n=1 Tax=Datura stramonium TaxID=4076 RepID=A0ABS8VCW9_DATST|nr:hypothetical protein [Datura stramonium]